MVGELLEHVGARLGLAVLEIGRECRSARIRLPGRYLNARSSARSTKPLTFSPSRIGIWRAISGDTLIGCSADSRSRMRPCAWSMRLTKMRCGMPSSSSTRSAGAASGARAGSGSTTTMATSATASAARAVGRKADRAGAVEDGEFVAEIVEIVEVEFGRAAARARFRAANRRCWSRWPSTPGGRWFRLRTASPRQGWSFPRRRVPPARLLGCLWILQLVRPCDSPFVR